MKFTKMYVCGEDFLITLFEDNQDYSNIAIKVLNRIIKSRQIDGSVAND